MFTMFVSASVATWSSTYSTPPSSQRATSSSSICRDAFEMSVSPAQNRSKPPPVPEMPTVTSPPPAVFQSSAALVVNGPTVLEPSAVISPPPLDDESSPPHPTATRESTAVHPSNVRSARIVMQPVSSAAHAHRDSQW